MFLIVYMNIGHNLNFNIAEASHLYQSSLLPGLVEVKHCLRKTCRACDDIMVINLHDILNTTLSYTYQVIYFTRDPSKLLYS